MSELELHRLLSFGVIAIGAAVFVALFWVVAPYGRHTRPGWGWAFSSRAGWMLMESPSAIVFLVVFIRGEHAGDWVPMLFAAMWLSHYVHRAFLYPFRMRSQPKGMPASVAAMAITFNLVNSYLNARWVSELGSYPDAWLGEPRFVLGALLFVGGMALNVTSDGILFRLRKGSDGGYRIPFGGGFRWVSAPNYLGELVEWGGFALATASLSGLAFFLFTAANLVPRAVAHHRWYREKFPDYPAERRAVIPYLV